VSSSAPEVVSAEIDGATARLTLDVPADLEWFEGHFPQAPILPGVIQLNWVMRLAEKHLGISRDFAGMEALKFQQVIQPGMRIALELEHRVDRDKLHFRISSDRGDHAKGRILLR
jgi:3-hydroxymyristoyl/3-hydroxydecanoyl-(acyl carrier protein) dehydratase